MSSGDRFFKSQGPRYQPTSPEEEKYLLLSSNRVTTRMVGSIEGCVEAVDVFVERTREDIIKMIASDGYQKVWDDYRNGVIGWNEWLNHPIHKRKPFSPFRNPAKSYLKDW